MNRQSAFDELMKAKKEMVAGTDLTINITPKKKNKILVPYEFDILKTYIGKLYGYIQQDTGVHTIIGWEGNEPDLALKAQMIGRVYHTGSNCQRNLFSDMDEVCIHGNIENNDTTYYFTHNKNPELNAGQKLKKEIYSITQDIFSRNTGLLETDKMKEKTVLIVGCGSVGSTLALQLTRSGVGRFVLVDTDTIEIHNICRHQCNLTDVGRFKTDALRDRMIAINPFVTIKCVNNIIQNITTNELDSLLDNQSVIVGCGDNRLSDAYSCEEAYTRNIPFISIGFWRRAFVCEIVTCIPQRGDTCYRCALQDTIEESIKVANQNRFYVGEEDRAKVAFESGISVDIDFGTTIGSKIVLDVLNLNDSNYISKVLHTLTQYTLVCNTNNVKIGGNDALMFSNPLQIVRNINFEKGKCKFCRHS